MKRRSALLGFGALVLTGCASMFGPRRITLTQEKMQGSLERRFPLTHRVLEVFEIVLSHPQIAVLPGEDRVALNMDARLGSRLGGASYNGMLALSGRLALDNQRNAVVLRETRIDQFYLDRLDTNTQSQMTRIANLLLDRVVRDIVVYSFHPDDLRVAGVQFMPSHIGTSPAGVVVDLEPLR
ncbi:MAG: DUF1439 domain-containing protein [Telluria sp.]